MSEPTRTQQLSDLKVELVAYVGFRKRYGRDITFREALTGQRQQVLENMRDDGDPFWRVRLDLLDELSTQEGLV